jgi:hypothetical protein
MTEDETGQIVFRNEVGTVIDQNGYRPPESSDNVVIDIGRKLENRHIHAQTCVTRWEGEQLDRHLAIGMLCDLDDKHPGTFPR